METSIEMVYDLRLRRIGCVLLQAAAGCRSDLCHLWDQWALEPTSDLVRILGTREQWEKRAARDNAHAKLNSPGEDALCP